MLLRLRQNEIGVISDIGKAFLQICVSPTDRDVLRFVRWDRQNSGKLEMFRHCRVVFGVSSSPFLLGATIELHLERASETATSKEKRQIIQKLAKSFYVDNCVTSVHTEEEMKSFREVATSVMSEGSFDLRCWENSEESDANNKTSVLGLIWEKREDTLKLALSTLGDSLPEKITMRVILSATQKRFDQIRWRVQSP